MRSLTWFIPALIILLAAELPAQKARSGIEVDQSPMIATSIEFPQAYSDPVDRLSRRLRKELERVSEGRAQDIMFFEGSSNDLMRRAANQNCRYVALVEIVEHAWTIDHPFQFPFLFHIFRNNFKMVGSVKLYRQGNDRPVLMKDYEISIGGPKVYQILAQNPHDGGLSIPYGRQKQLENEAEVKFINKAAKEIYKTMERYGG